ncbi:sororin [Morone saxatilis]|uniref:sororin n=1 Tax=Morone saxatilis TaxID=34816 RepID=UPI0015E1DC72|nr:sororin [Morone saxatilis]
MNGGDRRNTVAEFNGSQRRRSARLSCSPRVNRGDNMAPVVVKRSITVRKIAPRKTVAPSEHNKENRRRSAEEEEEEEGVQQKKQKVSTPGPVGSSSVEKKAAMPSPILPSPPPPLQEPVDPEDAAWSQKVRRSYSRLSEKSFNSPDSRETMFGFEKLTTPEVIRRVAVSKAGPEVSGSLSGLNSFTSLLEAEDCGSGLPERDANIPGVVLVKEKRRRRKVPQIDATELDAMAAKMNAEFEEAEVFELVVE